MDMFQAFSITGQNDHHGGAAWKKQTSSKCSYVVILEVQSHKGTKSRVVYDVKYIIATDFMMITRESKRKIWIDPMTSKQKLSIKF